MPIFFNLAIASDYILNNKLYIYHAPRCLGFGSAMGSTAVDRTKRASGSAYWWGHNIGTQEVPVSGWPVGPRAARAACHAADFGLFLTLPVLVREVGKNQIEETTKMTSTPKRRVDKNDVTPKKLLKRNHTGYHDSTLPPMAFAPALPYFRGVGAQ